MDRNFYNRAVLPMKQDAAGSKRQSMKSPPHFYTLTCIIGFGNAKYLWEERKV